MSRHGGPVWAPLALLLAAIAGACSLPGSAQANPHDVLQKSAQQLATLKTVSADVKFGPGITFDNFGLNSASTRIRLPADSDTTLKVKQQDFLIDVRIITVGGTTYLRLPFGQFAPLTSEQAASLPNLPGLLDSSKGLPSILPQGKNPILGGPDNVGGHDCDRVDTVYTADQVGAVLGAVKPAGDVKTQIWSGRDDHLIRKVLLAGQLVEAGKSTTVEIDLHDFNRPVDIVKPV